MEITIDRLKHSLAVARKMKEITLLNFKRSECDPEDAFTLGLVHDLGYEFVSKQDEHANKGGLILKMQGYKYWKEVYYHGALQTNGYKSHLLDLLNYADLTTGPTGEYLTIEERIADIAIRYGKGSKQEVEAKKLADQLNIESFSH